MESMQQLCGPVNETACYYQNNIINQDKTHDKNAFSTVYQSAETVSGGKVRGTSEMTLKEYKIYIYDEISKISLNASRDHWDIFINISEDGLKAMMNDPEYEKWVLDTIRKDFSAVGTSDKNTVEILKFGASKEEFEGEYYSLPSKRDIERARKECWERKEEIRKRRNKLLEKKKLEEKWYKQAVMAKYIELKHRDHLHQIQEENNALRMGKDYQMQDHSASLYAAARRKTRAYESSFLYGGTSFL